jgi:two-component system phosphate regulon response regulator PhoB
MKKKVLIIDDEVAFTNIVKLTLEGKGIYEVCVENNSRQAITSIRKFWPDIIILDVVMPELDGGEVHTQLMADPILKRIPIIFLSADVLVGAIEKHCRPLTGRLTLS